MMLFRRSLQSLRLLPSICSTTTTTKPTIPTTQRFYSQTNKFGRAAGPNSQRLIDQDRKFGATNYAPIECVLEHGEGVFLTDVDGERYFDFLSGYSSVNQGHRHPKILSAMQEQLLKLTITSRAFFNNVLPGTLEYLTSTFGYDRALMMNSGVEAWETAMKLARRWGYEIKGVPADQAVIISCIENFHGRSITAVSASTDPDSYKGYGPLLPGFEKIPFNDLNALEQALKNPNVVAFQVEPVQGEAGVIVPDQGFLHKAKQLCHAHNVLLVCDEIQSGLGRTGKLLACDHDDVRPDILVLGKALSGGMMPVSCVLARDEIMLTIKPGQHGSTFGGNPLACAVAQRSVEVLLEEGMVENSALVGKVMLNGLISIQNEFEFVSGARGRGLMLAVDVKSSEHRSGAKLNAAELCYLLRDRGLLAKQTHENTIRFSPPLILTEKQAEECLAIIHSAFTEYDRLRNE